MSSWGNNDNAANAPFWAINSALTSVDEQPVGTRPTAANVALLYGNTTSNVYTTGETVGLYLVDMDEVQVTPAAENTGWAIKKDFTGGRAGRTQWETLVSLASPVSTNPSDNSVLPDVSMTLNLSEPTPIVHGGGNTSVFVVTPTVVPAGTPLTYQWKRSATSNGSYTNVTNGTPANTTYSGGTTNTLTITPTDTTANGSFYRVVVTATPTLPGSTPLVVTSANAAIIVN
jgi:hypothetical protein